MSRRSAPLLLLCACLLAGSSAPARAQVVPDAPTPGALYQDGPDGRYLMGGTWLLRKDPNGVGLGEQWQNQVDQTGWSEVQVPNAWNANDFSDNSMRGSVAWYRKEFLVPADPTAVRWRLRFESVNNRARIWLNGQQIGRHTGPYLPFEVPATSIRPGQVNRLVVRVDSRRRAYDIPPSATLPSGRPGGGWWNFGGILREVYLRRVAAVDFSNVIVRPNLPCRTCPATVSVTATIRNTSHIRRHLSVSGSFGSHVLRFGKGNTVGPFGEATFRAGFRVAHPRLWSPADPFLYPVRLRAGGGGAFQPTYDVHSGIRSFRVSSRGRFILNGRPVSLRGVSMHEEEAGAGGALDPARREEDVNLLRQLGATVTRSHYPLHPETLELCDQAGILVWDESPVYQLKGKQLSSPIARANAKDFIAQEIRRDRNHASVFAWSVSNELPPRPKAGEERLLNTLVDTVKSLDTTRLVAIDVGAYPSVGTPDIYSRFDAVGINDYFGWYPGPGGSTADRTKLSAYLDNEHAYHPRQAIFVTEFGAEANRAGPVDEKGTFGFQRDFLAYHLGVFAKKRWLAGAIIWILRDFRTRPGWAGGNPTPDPPINFKGLVDDADKPKPAFDEVARLFNQTRQIVLRRLRR